VKEEVLLCPSCRAVAAAVAAAAGAGCTGVQSHLQQQTDPQCQFQAAAAAAAVEGGDRMTVDSKAQLGPVAGAGCQSCARVVRGRRVSLTLRRLDPAQNVLDMQG
jgi:hypothetical protein